MLPTYNIKIDPMAEVWHSVHLAFIPTRVIQNSILGQKPLCSMGTLFVVTVMMRDHCWVAGEMLTPILLSWLKTNWPTVRSPGLDMFFSLTQDI